ncbi:MAG: nucleotidyltransferase [Candidatus Nephrothrix sp. EaCA]|nr:MAG: nucleotidyltransferase [Candidatus Nephrothrix sp. EaCA]
MIHPLIQPYLPDIVNLLKAHQITQAAIFGSGVTDRFNEASDVDFLVTIKEGLDPVEAGEHLWDLTYELEALLHRKIDLLTERSLKNPYFIEEVNKTKLIIYG